MLQRNLKNLTKFRSFYMRKLQLARYKQIVDPNSILDQLKSDEKQNADIIKKYDKIYKPERTLEFNRRGDLVLYSGKPLKGITVITKFPFIQIDAASLLLTLNYWYNWFSQSYLMISCPMVFLWLTSFLSRSFQLQNLQWNISKLSLLKGGKILIVERTTIDGKQYKDWIEISKIDLITKDLQQFEEKNEDAEFLDQEGQLYRDLTFEVKDYVFKGYSINNQVLKFKQNGTVHDPEIFEAAIKGYHIDTTDFTINTEQSTRAFDSLDNYQFNFIYQVSFGRFIVFIIKLLVLSKPSANLIQDQGKNKNQFLNLQKQIQNNAKFNRFKEVQSKVLQINEKINPFLTNKSSQFVLKSSQVNLINLNACYNPHPTNTDINRIQYFYFSYLKDKIRFQDISSKFSLSLKCVETIQNNCKMIKEKFNTHKTKKNISQGNHKFQPHSLLDLI